MSTQIAKPVSWPHNAHKIIYNVETDIYQILVVFKRTSLTARFLWRDSSSVNLIAYAPWHCPLQELLKLSLSESDFFTCAIAIQCAQIRREIADLKSSPQNVELQSLHVLGHWSRKFISSYWIKISVMPFMEETISWLRTTIQSFDRDVRNVPDILTRILVQYQCI